MRNLNFVNVMVRVKERTGSARARVILNFRHVGLLRFTLKYIHYIHIIPGWAMHVAINQAMVMTQRD